MRKLKINLSLAFTDFLISLLDVNMDLIVIIKSSNSFLKGISSSDEILLN